MSIADLVDDTRFAVRGLRRTPGTTAIVVITLALGIGMTSAPLSMVDALIFRPYPVPHPGDVVTLVSTSKESGYGRFSYREYRDIRARARGYDGVIASGDLMTVGFSAGREDLPRVKGALLVSGDYFRVLGVEPSVGRGFRDDEDQAPGRDAVVVLGPDLFKRELASDPNVVGKTIRLNATDFTVIGVAPESFPGLFIFSRPDFYVPLAMARVFSGSPGSDPLEDRGARTLNVKARLKAGTTLQEARGELAGLARGFEREHPQASRGRGATVRTSLEMRTQADDAKWKFGIIFSLLSLAVLLVACTNVAGLLLSRARTRTREIAVRLALGSGRLRLVRLLLTESLVLSLLGGLSGMAVGYVGIDLFRSFQIPAELPVTIPFRMDTRLLAVSLAVTLLSALFCGLAPALQALRTDLVSGLKTADVDLPGKRRLAGRNALVVAQVSMSLMLLTAAFLMARSFRRDVLGGTGFATDHLLLARFDPRLVQYDAERTARFYGLLTDRVRGAPGVRSVALTQHPPQGLDEFATVAFVPEGVPLPRDQEKLVSMVDTVDEGYFETLGIPLVRGRGFLPSDTARTPRVAVVGEHFARHHWPGVEAVGRRLRLDGANGVPVEIVGVVRDIKYRNTTSADKPADFVYLPLAQNPVARMVLMVRTSGDPLALAQPLKEMVRTLNPNLPVLELRTYEDLYRYNSVDGPMVAIKLVATMGGVGLFLAIAGLYGLVAYNVSRRTREIGIRMAVGAQPGDVLRLVLGKGLALVGAGAAVGLAMSLGVERLMNAMVFDAGRVDVVSYLVVAPLLCLVTVLAAWVPARRASLVEPTRALRYE